MIKYITTKSLVALYTHTDNFIKRKEVMTNGIA